MYYNEEVLRIKYPHIWKLQQKLNSLPLISQDSKLRKRRDKIMKDLIEQAKKEHCLEHIKLF